MSHDVERGRKLAVKLHTFLLSFVLQLEPTERDVLLGFVLQLEPTERDVLVFLFCRF
jgi:hypothetical protein